MHQVHLYKSTCKISQRSIRITQQSIRKTAEKISFQAVSFSTKNPKGTLE